MATSKVALITGAAKRVGRAIALKLATEGCNIAFTYNGSEGEARDLEHQIQKLNREVLSIQSDFTNPQLASDHVFKSFTQRFPRLDALINNASLYQPSSLQTATDEQIQNLFAIHFHTPFLLARRFESLLRQSRGHIVNMLDLLADRPWPDYLAYSASKAALGSLTKGLARALAPDVTVNGISPGVVEWPEDYPQSEREKYLKRVPLNRAGTPEDVANLVHFLITDGSYITGQIIPLDGGRSIT
jgi:pteridine reductase